MILAIVLTAVITFVITALWGKYAYTKGHKNLYISFEALQNELDSLSQKLGHKDIYDYWLHAKGKEYADRGIQNINNALGFLRNK